MTEEIWKPVPSCAGHEASSLGRVRPIRSRYTNGRGQGSSGHDNGHGYLQITLHIEGAVVTRYVHRLVCEAFHGPAPSPLHEAAHGDRTPVHNTPDNLRWATKTENDADKKRHGTVLHGERHPMVRLTPDQVIEIRRRLGRGHRQADIADDFGIAPGTVSKIKNRRRWRHLEAA